jgi:hypothetical protein
VSGRGVVERAVSWLAERLVSIDLSSVSAQRGGGIFGAAA